MIDLTIGMIKCYFVTEKINPIITITEKHLCSDDENAKQLYFYFFLLAFNDANHWNSSNPLC